MLGYALLSDYDESCSGSQLTQMRFFSEEFRECELKFAYHLSMIKKIKKHNEESRKIIGVCFDYSDLENTSEYNVKVVECDPSSEYPFEGRILLKKTVLMYKPLRDLGASNGNV